MLIRKGNRIREWQDRILDVLEKQLQNQQWKEEVGERTPLREALNGNNTFFFQKED